MTRERSDSDCGTVAIVGLGYVGLPLCGLFHRAGFRVIGIDIDQAKIDMLTAGESYLRHLGETDLIKPMLRHPGFIPTSDPARSAEADAVLICVPTPLSSSGEPDLQYVLQTTRHIAQALKARGRSQLVCLESTTYPGTTREQLKPILDAAEVAYDLAFCPERVDPGRSEPPMHAIPKIVGGIDQASTGAAVSLYGHVFETVIPVASPDVAEAAKLMENVYRAVNIALANEMKVVLDRMGINVWEVIEAAATKPFGFQPFYPGPGLGGHCIPIDPFYLAWKASQVGCDAQFIELAGRVNRSMPARVVDITLKALGHATHSGDGPRILVLGLAYKPNIDDVRESPSFELISLFRQAGCRVEYSDPHVPHTHHMRHYGDLDMASVPLTSAALSAYDAVVIATAHDAFDWKEIATSARLIVDTRNAMRNFPNAPVVRA
ncbi:MAG: nucleotide sugar dehydrogenase [Planctomycetes bacterium]|nr:nucleotide sugar dehydrogenase [Planctomycetota bacterium]NOG53733.1 nucleotide sugar dehydrogenase [Planctomycetota bacterium]